MHPIKGYGPSLGDQGVGPEDAPLLSPVANCTGCTIVYDRETGEATIDYCADHDAEDNARERAALAADAIAAEDECDRLTAALLEYGQHKEGCVFWQDDAGDVDAYGPNGLCTCGLDDARRPDA